MTRYWRWWTPLLVFSVIATLDWARLHHNGIATSAESRRLFFLIGIAVIVSAGLKLIYSRAWPLQELGHLGLLLGLAGLSLRIIGRLGPQPTPEWQRDVIQALLDTGSAALLLGMVLWVIFHRQDHDEDEATPKVLYERRKRRRREEDRR